MLPNRTKRAWYQDQNARREIDGLITSPDGHFYCWYQDGLLHRENGPALYATNNRDHQYAWYLHGEFYAFIEWLEITPLDEEQKLLLKLQYG
jgi:hypothetical protein